MPNTIDFKLMPLDNSISCLKSLKARLDAIEMLPSDSRYAKGSTMDTIKEYNATYGQIKEALSGLIGDSAEFFTRVRREIEQAEYDIFKQLNEHMLDRREK